MEKFNVQSHGFEGCLYEVNQTDDSKCLILNLMFAPDSFMLKKLVKLITAHGVSALTLGSWGTKQTVPDENLVPLDYLLAACKCLKAKGYQKIGTVGLSMTAVMGMYSAALCSDISLTIALSGYDMLFEGVLGRGNQYPSGHSTLTLEGKELPYQPFYLDKAGYQSTMSEAKKAHGENYGRDLWEDSKKKKLHEDALIPVENIQGKLLLLCSENDTCWDSAGAATRIKERIQAKGGNAKVVIKTFEHGTHMLYPQEVPFINLMTKIAFKEYKNYPIECKESRRQVTQEILKSIKNW